MIGRTISHFRILDRIGEGGMGVVYRAEDEKLQRAVALKVLPPDRLLDEERRLRFLREARAAAAVTHPNIAVVHEIDEAGGVVFIAMELVEGRTLRSAIAGKPLALREALRLGVEIAEGLAAAHQARVIHRDLKPENVIVTPEGRVKLLDFGLAKLLEEPAAGTAEASRLATISDEMTQAGRVLGTAAYMSPEQARGLPVDARSDLFSFGIVLYEMVTGKAPFAGATPMDTLTAILRETPATPSGANPEVPAELERIVGKCLEKDPAERYQDSRDLVVDLRHLKRDTDSQPLRRAEGPAGAVAGRRRPLLGKWAALAGAGLILIAALALGAWSLLRRGPGAGGSAGPFQSMKMTRLASIKDLLSAVLSPDGRFMAYVARKGSNNGLWVRQVSTGSDVPIVPPQKELAFGLAFSPDGEFLYFRRGDPDNPGFGALYQVPVLGGTPRKILFDIDSAPAFSPDGREIAFMRGVPPVGNATPGIGLMLAHADGTGERKLAFSEWGKGFDLTVAPSWSPDGRRIAAMVYGPAEGDRAGIGEFDVDSGRQSRIGEKRWGSIVALSWLPDGSGIALIGSEAEESARQIWLVACPGGEARRITNDLSQYIGISLSADGRSLATVQVTVSSDLWVAPADDPAAAVAITSGEGNEYSPGVVLFTTADYSPGGIAASPAGSIIFRSVHGGSARIWAVAPDGTGRRPLTPEGMEVGRPMVARISGRIAYTARGSDAIPHVWRMDPDGGNPTQVTLGTGEYADAVSPDGRWVIFDKGSGQEFWRAPQDGGEPERIEIPRATGRLFPPQYSPDGKHLLSLTLRERDRRIPAFVLQRSPAAGGPGLGWMEVPRQCNFWSPFRWTPSGDAVTCIGDLEGIYNVWIQSFAGGEARPITRFKSGSVFDYDWSTDGKQLFMRRGEAATDVVLITNFR